MKNTQYATGMPSNDEQLVDNAHEVTPIDLQENINVEHFNGNRRKASIKVLMSLIQHNK